MNWFDIVIIAVILILGLIGLWRGATKTIFGIAGLVGGIILASHWYKELASLISPEKEIWASIVAFLIILITVLVLSAIASQLIKQLLNAVLLGWLDRGIGFALGVIIGLALCTLFVVVLSKIPGTGAFLSRSVLASFLIEQVPLFTISEPAQLV